MRDQAQRERPAEEIKDRAPRWALNVRDGPDADAVGSFAYGAGTRLPDTEDRCGTGFAHSWMTPATRAGGHDERHGLPDRGNA